jgi:D-tyrosyl-tRNA(Tyr) deacylase
MRVVVQRVSRASVAVDGQVVGRIGPGFVVLVGVANGDAQADIEYTASKLLGLRVFSDADGKMNRSITDVGGAMLLISQFTLLGDVRGGRRPSFIAAAAPDVGRAMYEELAAQLRASGMHVETGIFQAHMEVELVNDGPVTLLIDSKKSF